MNISEICAKHGLSPKYAFQNITGQTWFIDPKQAFAGKAEPHYLCECMGLIPTFIYNVDNVIETALAEYGFGGTPSTCGTVKMGVYSYPNDPDMMPLGCTYCEKQDMMVFIYDAGFVAFVTDEKTEIYRFD